jgi:hypothetical protein
MGDGVLVLAPLEVRPGQTDPSAYGHAYDATRPPFDYVWFTAGTKRDDPCNTLHKNN